MSIANHLAAAAAVVILGCGPRDARPVDIFPEDGCSSCRMAISDESFASEIIDGEGDVFKFDDLGCLAEYRKNHPALAVRALFVKDYETKSWMPYEQSTIVQTGLKTPMGSGNVAFRDPAKAKEFAAQHPPELSAAAKRGCCATKEE